LNVAVVNVFIREPFAEKLLTDEKISKISFMSDVGGLMGLFMGFSFVSAIEIIYHAFRVNSSKKCQWFGPIIITTLRNLMEKFELKKFD
jgi:hypothetical protein